MAKKHKGVREWEPGEISSVALGQNGFKIISNATVVCGPGGTTGFTDIAYFIALKAIQDDAVVEAVSLTKGHDFTAGVGGVYTGLNGLTLAEADIIYGAFSTVRVAGGDYIIAYIGRGV